MYQISLQQIAPLPKTAPKSKDETQKTTEDNLQQKQPRQIWFYELFRFATTFDIILMVVGSIAALGMGAAMPSFAYIWGHMTDAFASNDMVNASKTTLLTFLYVGIGTFIAGWLMFACWMITGQRQAISCRKQYLRSLLRQQIGWFDKINQTQLASKFAKDTFAFQGAIGQKVSTLIMTIGSMIAGFTFAFVSGWLMTLVILATLPALGIAGFFFMKTIGQKDKNQQAAYAQAGGIAQQALSSIKTVKQLNGQHFEKDKYSRYLEQATSSSLKLTLFSALSVASLFFCMLASYSFGFWYGSKCILNTNDCPSNISRQTYTAGSVLVVFFSVLMSGFNISQLTPAFKKISQGKQSAIRIFQIIDRQPQIKNPQNGIKIQHIKGIIKFENVTFSYPRDKSKNVLSKINLQFNINKNGLVGQSGCGKSTILQLIMRFYDPNQGKITLDGYNLKTLDLKWLRQQIGYVGQQPVLFATTIKQNLLFGNDRATQTDINQALKMAQAYDFIQSLSQKLNTYVGYGGGQLSGGQKQRIAIARAILRKPKIILLDQATSALDRRNQKLIQSTLEKVTKGITTITVAHRVKTIMNSDIIYVLDKGGVVQQGKFQNLHMFKNHQHEIQHQHEHPEDKKSPQAQQTTKKQSQQQQFQKQQIPPNNPTSQLPLTKEQIQKQQNERLVKKYEKSIFPRLFSYSTDKIPLFILGTIVSLISGVVFPTFSIFLSKMLTALLSIQINKNDLKQISNINLYALIFLILGIISFVLTTLQLFCFQKVGTQITKKIRLQTFYKMLKMPIKWFDIPRNNAGTLSARLSTDCQIVNSMTTTIIQIIIQNVSTLISGITIAFIYQWKTSLVALGLLPIMIIAGAIQMSFNTGFSNKTDAAYKDSSSLIMEAMINIRTVSSFGYEGIIAQRYDQKMIQPYALAIRKGNASGFFFGLSQLIMFIIVGLLFYLGAIFVRDSNGKITVTDMFTAVYGIMFAGMTAGNNSHFMPDTAACKNSAANLFQILDSQDQQQSQVNYQSKMITDGIKQGDIQLNNISFKYQSRTQYVFQNLSITIKNGNKVAFVGISGCGKSTIIQLLQRFYDVESLTNQNQNNNNNGKILINGVDIKDYDIHYLRSSFGVVSQEPVLMSGSFKQNIRYNLTQTQAPDDQIQKAAQLANALSFITGTQQLLNKPDQKLSPQQQPPQNKSGFDRNVGIKGSFISGGQKQRIAIARTILRNPSKLMLDEATSALDRPNQQKVQNSLDHIMIGKTVISVAHRIQTIKNSDRIFVFEKGKIVQMGKYQQLVANKGYFYNLQRGTQFT